MQIALDLSLRPDYRGTAFVNAPSNEEARLALKSYQTWPMGTLALIGPQGSGKTHLGHHWHEDIGALKISTDANLAHMAQWRSKVLWLDDADQADEELLFALINMGMRGDIIGILLCSQHPPSSWNVQIPDLRSRLGALQVARIYEPEDQLLTAIYHKLFLDRGLKVQDNLISYLLLREQRSVDAAYAVVDRLDKLAAIEKVNVTRAFAAKQLGTAENLSLFD